MPRADAERLALQTRWYNLSFEARVEVLGRLMVDTCLANGVDPPLLMIGSHELQYDEKGNVIGQVLGSYDDSLKTITVLWDASIDDEAGVARRQVDYLELAIKTVLHEVAHHIDYIGRDVGTPSPDQWLQESDQLVNFDGENDPHPNIYDAAAQWVEEYLGPNRPKLEHILAEGEALDWELYGDHPPSADLPTTEEDWGDVEEIHAPSPAPRPRGQRRKGQRRKGKPAPASYDPEGRPSDFPTPSFHHGRAVAALARWLRNPDYWLGDRSSVQLNRDYLNDIWDKAMRLSRDDEARALPVAIEAVRPVALPGESNEAREARLAGIPFRMFSADPDFEGVELVSDFFRAARESYEAGWGDEEGPNWISRAFQWLRGVKSKDVEASVGEVWAKSLGTGFGAALRWNPDQSIERFLRRAPRPDEALPIRAGARLNGGYVSDIVVPAPEALLDGTPIEVRAVDRDGYAQTFVLTGRKGQKEVAGSAYRLTRDDPWYVPKDERESDGDRDLPRSIREEQADIDRSTDSAREVRRRLFEDMEDLHVNQDRLQRELARRQQDEDRRRLMQQQEETERRLRETQDRIERNNQHLQQLSQERQNFYDRWNQHASAQQTHEAIALQDRIRDYAARAHEHDQRQNERDRQAEDRRREQRDRDQRERDQRGRDQRERDERQRSFERTSQTGSGIGNTTGPGDHNRIHITVSGALFPNDPNFRPK